MKNLLLSVALIAVPVGVFAAVESVLPHAPADTAQSQPAPTLGDLARYQTIVTDVQKISASGDLTAAEKRVTDFEVLWDKEASDLRAKDRAAWNGIDTAADEAFAALRAKAPDASKVDATLTALSASLVDTSPAQATGPVKMIAGIAVTDDTGKALPCEEMLGQIKAAAATVTDPQIKTQVADFQSKGTERCNADDDAHADAFFAQGLALTQN
ncbi:hypothetical protein [Pseudooceanicola nitratireducens]|jgi:hypothetical protein|uniref:hypothetical protein n=1 Tax=Pseudooceanicola nitratireducens TaxID=517719 RepID=UPI003515375F